MLSRATVPFNYLSNSYALRSVVKPEYIDAQAVGSTAARRDRFTYAHPLSSSIIMSRGSSPSPPRVKGVINPGTYDAVRNDNKFTEQSEHYRPTSWGGARWSRPGASIP